MGRSIGSADERIVRIVTNCRGAVGDIAPALSSGGSMVRNRMFPMGVPSLDSGGEREGQKSQQRADISSHSRRDEEIIILSAGKAWGISGLNSSVPSPPPPGVSNNILKDGSVSPQAGSEGNPMEYSKKPQVT